MALLNTTKLNAVNTCLAVIGESPVNSLNSGLDEAISAETTLDEISRAVQMLGWAFNTEEDYPLALSIDDDIVLPTNTLKIDGEGRRYVRRGTRLYDKMNHTFTFSSTVRLTITFGLDFEELPEAARQYIMIRAARTFQAREVGSQTLNRFTEGDEKKAWIALQAFESDASDVSIFDSVDMQLMNDRSATPFRDYPAGSIFDV